MSSSVRTATVAVGILSLAAAIAFFAHRYTPLGFFNLWGLLTGAGSIVGAVVAIAGGSGASDDGASDSNADRGRSDDPAPEASRLNRIAVRGADAEKRDGPTNPIPGQGFRLLDDEEFRNREVDREHCWRRPFTLAEIAAGIPIDRERPDDERTDVTEELLDALAGGGAVALIGAPGAGKTTISKTVAYRWHSRGGSVLYRQSGRASVTDPDGFVESVRELAADSHVLVLAEDAARHETVRLFEAVEALKPDESVSILLNARRGEWENFDDVAAYHDSLDTTSKYGQTVLRRRYLTEITVPELDEREVERLLQRFASETGRNVIDQAVVDSPAALLARVRSQGGVSPMLLLSYHLPVGGMRVEPEEGRSALRDTVNEIHGRIAGQSADEQLAEAGSDTDLLQDLALLINVLNAADLPLYPEYLYALGNEPEEFIAIDRARETLDNLLLFGREQDGAYWSHHPVWSELYLQQHLESSTSERAARETFERVLNALFSFLDMDGWTWGVLGDESKTEAIRDHLGRDTPRLIDDADLRRERAYEFVSRVFWMFRRRPRLAPLIATSERSGIELPRCCSAAAPLFCAMVRADVYLALGEPNRARAELEAHDDGPEWLNVERRTLLGTIDMAEGNVETARERFETSLRTAQESDNPHGIANSRLQLAVADCADGDLGTAKKRAKEGHESAAANGWHILDAQALRILGKVARLERDYSLASERFEEYLAVARKTGNLRTESEALLEIGETARQQEEYEEARDHFEQALRLCQKAGDKGTMAGILDHLGVVAMEQERFDAADDHLQRALDIARETGKIEVEATALKNRGLLAYNRGDYETAREYLEESLDIVRSRVTKAPTLKTLGLVAKELEDYGDAREAFEAALDMQKANDLLKSELKTRRDLIRLELQAGDSEAARERLDRADTRLDRLDGTYSDERERFESLRERPDDECSMG